MERAFWYARASAGLIWRCSRVSAEVVQRIDPKLRSAIFPNAQVEHVLSKEASQYLQLAHANGRNCPANS